MNENQQQLIDTTLKVVSRLAFLGLACWVGYWLYELYEQRGRYELSGLIVGLLDPNKAGPITYSLLILGISTMWNRKFMKAGKSGRKVEQ